MERAMGIDRIKASDSANSRVCSQREEGERDGTDRKVRQRDGDEEP